MNYTLKFGKKFDREFGKIDKSISEQIIKKLKRLKETPDHVGKPLLHTKPALWEFKAESFRGFYMIKKDVQEVWLLSLKHKDECDAYIRTGYLRDINEF